MEHVCGGWDAFKFPKMQASEGKINQTIYLNLVGIFLYIVKCVAKEMSSGLLKSHGGEKFKPASF